MTTIIRLEPHDPLPERGDFALVLRRFGEDDPHMIITEIDFFGRAPMMQLAVGEHGEVPSWEDAVQMARAEAAQSGLPVLYAVDRTAGRREQEVLAHNGDHSVFSGELSDTDEEEGVTGSSILDRPPGAGFWR